MLLKVVLSGENKQYILFANPIELIKFNEKLLIKL